MDADPVVVARALPPRSGIIFRHYQTSAPERIRLARKLRRIAKARGHMFLVAGKPADARPVGADGWHAPSHRGCDIARAFSTGAHDERELARAIRLSTPVVFISPVFATLSHPGGSVLGRQGFARLARRLGKRGMGVAIALGGMDAARFRALRHHGAHGWAAIDALSVVDQKS